MLTIIISDHWSQWWSPWPGDMEEKGEANANRSKFSWRRLNHFSFSLSTLLGCLHLQVTSKIILAMSFVMPSRFGKLVLYQWDKLLLTCTWQTFDKFFWQILDGYLKNSFDIYSRTLDNIFAQCWQWLEPASHSRGDILLKLHFWYWMVIDQEYNH